jgi:hypothetical protein
MDEAEKELVSVAQAHWVDSAAGEDLERLGALYEIERKPLEPDPDFRNRLKTAIISYRGGGTVGAVQTVVRIALRLPMDHPVEIVENPEIQFMRTWKVRSGQEWTVNPRSIAETVPELTITVEMENGRITEPTLTNLTTGESIVYKGEVGHGEELKIIDGMASLNGEDRTDMLSTRKVPSLPRRRSRWQFKEYLGANQGVFDESQFDRSVFVVDVTSSVTFVWVACQPAAFEVRIPRDSLEKAGISAEYLQDMVNSAKACGVRGEVKVI